MDALQNLTDEKPAVSGESPELAKLKVAQDYYITFYAGAGLSVNDDGEIFKVTASEFANKIGYSRQTLYDWQKSIPDFQARVKARRKEIFTSNRENVIWRGLLLRAAKGDSKQAEMILSHFSDYVPPTQRHEVKLGGLVDLAKIARGKSDGSPNEQ